MILLAVMSLMGTDLFAPSLPAIASFFGQSAAHTQLTISLFLLGFAFSQLFYGPVSDSYGRKPLLMLGTLLFILGSIICLFSDSFEGICFGRVIQGIGVGGGLSLTRVVLRDLYHGPLLAQRSSQMAFFISSTPAIAPFVGGFLQQHFGFRASFIFMLLYGVMVLFLLLRVFQETLPEKKSAFSLRETFSNYGKILSHRLFMRYVIIAGFSFSAIILCANIIPFVIQNTLKLSPMQNGEILLIAALGISFGALISSRIVKSMTPQKLVKIGVTILALGGLLLMITHALFGTYLVFLMPLIFLNMTACGFLFPNALAVAFSSVHEKIGTAGAVYGATQIAISTGINFLLNFMPHQNQFLLGAFYFILGGLGLVLLLKTSIVVRCDEVNAMIE
jgi:DHA1 family 2-module integral membrane pump EmrD-like MFS transporter